VRLPELDEKSGEAAVSFWYYDKGEKVAKGEDLLEVVTDKATFNVPVPESGTLAEVGAAEGQGVQPGDLLGVIETEG